MEKKPEGGGLVVVAVAAGMVVCCAVPVLLLSGGLGAVMAWLFDGSGIYLLLAGALALAAGGLFLAHRRGAGTNPEDRPRTNSADR